MKGFVVKSFNKSTLLKILKILKWGKIVAKIAALGTTIAGAVTAFTSSSASTGVAIGAAGATSYAAAKSLPSGYEKTKHIAPRALHRNNAAGRAIAAARAKPKVGAHPAAPVPKSPAKDGKTTASLEEQLRKMMMEEESSTPAKPAASPAAAPKTPVFKERAPVIVVTTEEEDEFDENHIKMKRIRKTALNFLTDEPKKDG